MLLRFAILALVACGQPAKPVDKPPPPVEPPPVATPLKRPPREVFATSPSPTSIAVANGALYWTDAAGAIWTMPTSGGTPKQLSDQRSPDFAFKVVAVGDAIVASSRKDFLRVGDTVTKMNVTGLVEYPEDVVADAQHVYCTMFKKTQIMRVPAGGGAAQAIGELPRGVLAHHGDTIYAASYATGVLVAIPKAGGKPRTIAKGLVRPTALVADATHAYAYSEKEQTLKRIDLANGAATVIATGLVNSDELVIDGAWLYTRTWKRGNTGAILRVAKDGSRPQDVIGDDLAAPYNIAFDDEAIYVTVRDAAQIVRFAKAAMP